MSIAEGHHAADQTDDLVSLLRARGRRVTSQRLVILRELRRRRRHASAEQIHQAVRAQLPGISAPTVYAVLELLVELGLARKLDVGVGTSLYDARLERHHHMVCRRCGAVEDLDAALDAESAVRSARATGFQPEHADLVVSGVCGSCAPHEP
jgi:Fe2+ or Zn2+ uptake regulation protein